MGKYIGIDLGTTFSVAAYINSSGNPEVIDNQEGENTTPSTVLFEDENVIVGSDAKKESIVNPEHFVGFVKRNMGNNQVSYKVDQKKYKPEEISAIILKKIKQDVEQALGDKVLGAVITVPAYFTDAQRRATTDAARLAEIPVLSIINEPTAAALAYGISKGSDEKKKILVYDLGGGTFDVSIMQFGGNVIEILSSMGNPELGGYDFDKKIVEWFIQEARLDHVDIEHEADAKQELLMKAEEAKKSLSQGRNKARITISAQGKKLTKELSREQFENMIEPVMYQTISLMDAAMEEANLEYSDLDKILLVGGSTRIPLVKSMIQEETEIEPSQDIHPDEAVAVGAAYHAVECAKNAAENSGETEKNGSCRSAETEAIIEPESIPELEEQYVFIDRTSHGIGVIVLDENGEEFNSVVLPKNTVVPAESKADYYTMADYQESIRLRVTQGESTELKYTTIIGEAELKVRPKPKGVPIRVVISCDGDAMIHVHVIDMQDNENLGEMKIDRVANMSNQEVEEAKDKIGKLNIGWED